MICRGIREEGEGVTSKAYALYRNTIFPIQKACMETKSAYFECTYFMDGPNRYVQVGKDSVCNEIIIYKFQS